MNLLLLSRGENKLIRVRRLAGCYTIDYIYKSTFNNTPKSLFLCIWPQKPAEPRACFKLRVNSKKNKISRQPRWLIFPEALGCQLVLCSEQKSFLKQSKPFCLKFEKKSTALDGEYFFWSNMAKGSHPEIKSEEVNSSQVVFAVNAKNRNRKFQEMLAVAKRNFSFTSNEAKLVCIDEFKLPSVQKSAEIFCHNLNLRKINHPITRVPLTLEVKKIVGYAE